VRRRPAGALFLAAASITAALLEPAVCQPLAPDDGGTRIGERETLPSDEEAARRLKELQPQWADAARRYENYALRWFCTEAHRTIDYSRSVGEAKSEKEIPYGYLLTLDPKNARYDVVRQTLDDQKRPTGNEKVIDLRCPEPYGWTFLFLPSIASTMRFRYLGREIQNYRLTYVVGFEGSSPHEEGKDIREWSGTVWIEENTGNIVRVEARPTFQNARIMAIWREYQQSFGLPFGLKSKARPHGYVLAQVFDYERDGLLFPTRLDLADFVWVATNREALDTRLVLTYDDYHFFYVEPRETIHPPAAASGGN
jgi:hypothetical protein